MTPAGPPEHVRAPGARVLGRRGPGALLLALSLCAVSVVAAVPTSAAPVTLLVRDAFSRTVAGGWGTADTGGAWSAATTSRFAVSGGAGTMALTSDGQTQQANLPGAGSANDLTATFTASRTPTGGGLYVSVAGRRIAGVGQYEAKVRWLSGGAVAVSLGRVDARWAETIISPAVTVPNVRGTTGQLVRVRVQVSGAGPTTVRAKVWQASASEPTAWTRTATDATAGWQGEGGVGLGAYLSRSSVALNVRVDDVAGSLTSEVSEPVIPPPLPPPPPGTGNGSGDPVLLPATGRSGDTAGAAALGTTEYPAPDDALYVSPTGSDTGAGTLTSPWQSVTKAVNSAPDGATVVLREGTYTESVTIPKGKRLTLQPYPRETVWFDGSRDVSGWVADGAAWRVNGWTAQFDHSPTYTKGAADGRSPGWSFVNPAYPMAAYPDMVFIDGVPQWQVASRAAVTEGTFYVDDGGDRLYLGTDPAGHSVRASTLSIGLTVYGAGSVVRGIGVQRYATPVPDKGALRALAPDVTLENVVVRDNATQGIYVGGQNLGIRNTLRHVTAQGNGLLGIESSFSDGLVVDAVRVTGNNIERFNQAPVSGGMKICSARDLSVTGSVFADNVGTGLWFDESVHGVTVARNDILRNTGHGISYEISSQAVIADNLVAGNGDAGMKINNASRIEIWNNTVVDNAGRPIWVVQDSRLASNRNTAGHDPRQAFPDPTVTWLLGPVTLGNNVVGGRTTANCVLCVQDTALRRTPAQIGLVVDGNVWGRPGATTPTVLATWPTGSSSTRTYPTLAALTAGIAQEAHGAELTGPALVDAAYRLTAETTAAAAVVQPLPGWISALAGASGLDPWLGARFG
ncbi:MAG: putative sortase-sorted surface protein [Blastococcus sp.]|nr:putative sortase-sorted surface protein [Blastococcus sp.]